MQLLTVLTIFAIICTISGGEVLQKRDTKYDLSDLMSMKYDIVDKDFQDFSDDDNSNLEIHTIEFTTPRRTESGIRPSSSYMYTRLRQIYQRWRNYRTRMMNYYLREQAYKAAQLSEGGASNKSPLVEVIE